MAEDRADQKARFLEVDGHVVAQLSPWRPIQMRNQSVADLQSRVDTLTAQLERDQALLAKEQHRWWPKLWQAALVFWGLALVWSAVWFLVGLSEGNWTGMIASALLAVVLLMGPIKERRGPRDPS